MNARNSLMILCSIVLTLALWTSSANSQEATTTTTTLGSEIASRGCTTNQSDGWICAGDRAWETGYLVAPKTMGRIVAMRLEHRELRLLVDRLVLERDTAVEQRDSALEAVAMRDVKLYEWERRESDIEAWAQHRQGGEISWTTGALLGAGGVVLGVVVGVLAGGVR